MRVPAQRYRLRLAEHYRNHEWPGNLHYPGTVIMTGTSKYYREWRQNFYNLQTSVPQQYPLDHGSNGWYDLTVALAQR